MVQRAATGFASHRHAALFLLDNMPGFVRQVLLLASPKMNRRALREREGVHAVRLRGASVDADIAKGDAGEALQARPQAARKPVRVRLHDAADRAIPGQRESISRGLAHALRARRRVDGAALLVFGTDSEPANSPHPGPPSWNEASILWPGNRQAEAAATRYPSSVGRRKNRKRERRQEQHSRERWTHQPQVTEEDFLQPEPMTSLLGITQRHDFHGFRAELPKTCGNCRQFVEDHDFGRGTCLHIASGILNPYTDTPACEYFERTKSAARR